MIEKVDSFKNRFEKALTIRGMRPVDLSEITKISQPTISQYRSGYAEPKSDNLCVIADALSVNPTWLMGIDVPMDMPTDINMHPPIYGGFAANEIIENKPTDALNKFLNLTDEDKQIAIGVINALHEKEAKNS